MPYKNLIKRKSYHKKYSKKWNILNKNKIRKHKKSYYLINKERLDKKTKETKLKNRQIVYNHYGNKCSCCGEDNIYFLTIDHVNNDGQKDRLKSGFKRKGNSLYIKIIKENFPNTYQLLCWNCNCSKGMNKGICGHRLIIGFLGI